MKPLATNALIINLKFVKIISELVAKNKGSTANWHKTHQRLEFPKKSLTLYLPPRSLYPGLHRKTLKFLTRL